MTEKQAKESKKKRKANKRNKHKQNPPHQKPTPPAGGRFFAFKSTGLALQKYISHFSKVKKCNQKYYKIETTT